MNIAGTEKRLGIDDIALIKVISTKGEVLSQRADFFVNDEIKIREHPEQNTYINKYGVEDLKRMGNLLFKNPPSDDEWLVFGPNDKGYVSITRLTEDEIFNKAIVIASDGHVTVAKERKGQEEE